MTSKRMLRTGPAPVRTFPVLGVVAAFCAAAAPFSLAAPAHAAPASAAAAAAAPAGQGIADFYAARRGQLLWFGFGTSGTEADALLGLLETAAIDGLNPRKYKVKAIAKAVRAARSGDRKARQRADSMLSEALVAYVRDLRRPGSLGIVYVDRELAPGPPSPRTILQQAAAAPSLGDYLAGMDFMHPLYGELRSALGSGAYTSEDERRQLVLNLERARELPSAARRHVLVNAAAQRLFVYEDGKVVDSMRVVVGKPKNPTPMMAALIRYTALNPYWFVPTDLAAERIAPNVEKLGLGYLRQKGYQVLSDWSDDPDIVDPSTIDWKAVAEGRLEVRIRQLPGPDNAMGRMKFMFPNNEGVYLHDTPEKELLTEASRLFSGGCVRLEDAPRLAQWLYGRPLSHKGARAEQEVPLERPVPVYITYLTAVPSGSAIAWYDDIYGRDAARLAQLRSGSRIASSR